MLAALSHAALAIAGLFTIAVLSTLAAAGKPTPKAPERACPLSDSDND